MGDSRAFCCVGDSCGEGTSASSCLGSLHVCPGLAHSCVKVTLLSRCVFWGMLTEKVAVSGKNSWLHHSHHALSATGRSWLLLLLSTSLPELPGRPATLHGTHLPVLGCSFLPVLSLLYSGSGPGMWRDVSPHASLPTGRELQVPVVTVSPVLTSELPHMEPRALFHDFPPFLQLLVSFCLPSSCLALPPSS